MAVNFCSIIETFVVLQLNIAGYCCLAALLLFLASDGVFTVEEAVDTIGFGRFQTKFTLLVGLAWVSIKFVLLFRVPVEGR